jgi:signal transduction histidine kinase
MLDAPRAPRLGLGDRQDSPDGGPLLLIDAVACLVLDANSEGWQALGLDPRTVTVPASLDRAMPALRRLAQCADTGQRERLTFWGQHGMVQLDCRVDSAGGGTYIVRACPLRDAQQSRSTSVAPNASARLAHELRTPLGAAVAYAEILKDERFGPIANARYRDYARNIFDSLRHTLGVVESMLANGARTGVPELAFSDLDVPAVIESCLSVVRPHAAEAGLSVSSDICDRVPRVIADEVTLKQMLLNLLTNAIKYGRRGDRVTVRAVHELDGPLKIMVIDTGPGIDPTPAPSSASKAGLGIGLPLTRVLAEANGAALAIDSAPGRGTSVTISFGKDRLVPV